MNGILRRSEVISKVQRVEFRELIRIQQGGGADEGVGVRWA